MGGETGAYVRGRITETPLNQRWWDAYCVLLRAVPESRRQRAQKQLLEGGRKCASRAQEQRAAAEKGHKRLRRRCGENASLRKKEPRAQATDTPQPFCGWYLQCRCCRGKCARQSPAACALRARAVGEEAHVQDLVPEATARAFSSPPLLFCGWVQETK